MIVYYRLSGIPSTNPSPIYQEDKYKLNELCLKSFWAAYKELDPKVIVLADHCESRYDGMISGILPFFNYEIIHTELGINGTALKQYELALAQDDDILFQECDYIYVPESGYLMEKAIRELGLVSPYDHLNFYFDRNLHKEEATIKLVGDYHFRSTERNTMTFGVRNDVFKKNYEIFKKYGYLDGDVWYDLLAAGQQLFVPIPSLATHMAKDFLAPSIDWEEIWNTQLLS